MINKTAACLLVLEFCALLGAGAIQAASPAVGPDGTPAPLVDPSGTLPDGALVEVKLDTQFFVLMPESKIMWTDWEHPSSWRLCFDGSRKVKKIFRAPGNSQDLYRQDVDGTIWRSSLDWAHEWTVKWDDVNAQNSGNPQVQLIEDGATGHWYSLRADGQIWSLSGTGVNSFTSVYTPKDGLFGSKRPRPEWIWAESERLHRRDTDGSTWSYFGPTWGWDRGDGPEHANG